MTREERVHGAKLFSVILFERYDDSLSPTEKTHVVILYFTLADLSNKHKSFNFFAHASGGDGGVMVYGAWVVLLCCCVRRRFGYS